jgi:uncharacterized protein (TIRG00374 family)
VSDPARHHGVADRLEEAIEHRAHVDDEIARGAIAVPPSTKIRRIALVLAAMGISLYLVAPSLLDTLGSWQRLREFGAGWLLVMLATQAASTLCLWAVQRLALHGGAWFCVGTAQLAGNALAKVVPGGGAAGAALQYRMLVQAGYDKARAAGALAAVNLLVYGVVLALPVVALPSILHGAVPRGLVEATLAAVVVFLILFALSAACLARDRLLYRIGEAVQVVRNRLRRHAIPLRTLPDRLLRERDRILAALGPSWRGALLATVGRWAFDYATLLAALAAVGSRPAPAVALIAFCAAQLLSQVPATPGGLGFVEAGLTATLTLAGVRADDAVLATFAYRLFSYWLPLPVGVVSYVLHRRRFATP